MNKLVNANGNFISLQNVSNGQLLPNRELSIIDLQLPVRKPSSPAITTQVNAQQQLLNMSLTKKNSGSATNAKPTGEYYASQSHHSSTSDANEAHTGGGGGVTPSKIMLTAIIKPQLNLNHTHQQHHHIQPTNTNQENTSRTMDAHFQEISQFFNPNDPHSISNGFEQLLNGSGGHGDKNNSSTLNFSNYKNKNYFKYVMNQQKKRQQVNGCANNNGNNGGAGIVTFANSVSSETLNSPNASNKRSQVQLLSHEVPIHSNLNNISSNALLIRRLKF